MTTEETKKAIYSILGSLNDEKEYEPAPSVNNMIDKVAFNLMMGPQVECPIRELFTPGLYIREGTLLKGVMAVSAIHKTEHPFVVSKGHVMVFTKDGIEDIKAPYTGITKPGTRRVLYGVEDTIWTTFHVTDKKSVTEILEDILVKHPNPLLNK